MKKTGWRRQVDLMLLGATAILSIVISVLDFLGLLDKIPWLNLNVSSLSLLLLGMVALFLAVERRNFLEGIEEKLQAGLIDVLSKGEEHTQFIINSLNGVAVHKFDSILECITYTNQRISQAKLGIDDTSINPVVGLSGHLPQIRKKSSDHRARIAIAAQKLPYREIFLFNRPTSSRFEKLQDRLKENAPGYSCAYYPEAPETPLLQFMIIDGEEVIFLSDQYPTLLAIRHPAVVQLFKEYYDEMWKKAIPIKTGIKINHEVANKILENWQDRK